MPGSYQNGGRGPGRYAGYRNLVWTPPNQPSSRRSSTTISPTTTVSPLEQVSSNQPQTDRTKPTATTTATVTATTNAPTAVPQTEEPSVTQAREPSVPQAREPSVPQAGEPSVLQVEEPSVLQVEELSIPQAEELSIPQEDPSARTARINSEISALFRPPPQSTPAYTPLKGIGLYTHIQGARNTKEIRFPHERYTQTVGPPQLLPFGGPDPDGRRGRARETEADSLGWNSPAKKIWEEMRDIIIAEEKMSAEEKTKTEESELDLRERFGGLDQPTFVSPMKPVEPGGGITDTVMAGQKRKQSQDSVESESKRRRSSTSTLAVDCGHLSIQSPDEDTSMGGIDPPIAPSENMYDAARDPRRRGRK